MAPHQAQRTLVKSRPELWSEVSDVAALGRHLGEFGEITITRLEPETTVAWEGTAARGTVELEASGWGTKVTLTAELVEAPAADDTPATDDTPVLEPGSDGGEPADPPCEQASAQPAPATPAVRADPQPESVPVAEPAPTPTPAAARSAARQAPARPAPAPKQGFFSRLFGRKAPAPAPVPVARPVETPPAEPSPLRVDPEPEPEPEPEAVVPTKPVVPVREPEPEPPLLADREPAAVTVPEVAPTAVIVLDGERAVEVLTAALDDLGAAHRRPFSHT